jgi:hypothetical protein
VSKERLKLNTFGDSRYKTQNCQVVKLNLKKPGFDETVTINALSFPVLCSPLPSRINTNCPHLEGLDLADDWDQTDGAIDLLIGSDHYWDIVTGETRTGEMGPVAVKLVIVRTCHWYIKQQHGNSFQPDYFMTC